jgi:hypothetical protein
LGDFDGSILREQENARDKTGNVGSRGGQVDVLAGIGEFKKASGDSETNEQQEGYGGGGNQDDETVAERRPDEPPPARDDDIVARQIREAASREKDPEQRKILWEEYRRYKGEKE